jgi:hypothetical protein
MWKEVAYLEKANILLMQEVGFGISGRGRLLHRSLDNNAINDLPYSPIAGHCPALA